MTVEHEIDSAEEFTELVNQNGLCKLFANRVRARILVTLFYTDTPMTIGEIADGADIDRTVVIEALDLLEAFDIFEIHDQESESPRFQIASDDELVEQIRALAELATNRYYGDGEQAVEEPTDENE